MKRRYPSDLELKMSADEVDLNSFRKFFSDEWLSKGLDTPVHDLWRDQSNCASVELYLYDQCLRALEPIQKAWVDEKRNSIINHPDQRHVGGALAEVIFAGAFKLGGYQVELASKSQPVYDFSIESKSNVTPYISCKYVGAKNVPGCSGPHFSVVAEMQLG